MLIYTASIFTSSLCGYDGDGGDPVEARRVTAAAVDGAAEALRAAGYEVFSLPPHLQAKIDFGDEYSVPGDDNLLIQREVGDDYITNSLGNPMFNRAMMAEIGAVLKRFDGDWWEGQYGPVCFEPRAYFEAQFDPVKGAALTARMKRVRRNLLRRLSPTVRQNIARRLRELRLQRPPRPRLYACCVFNGNSLKDDRNAAAAALRAAGYWVGRPKAELQAELEKATHNFFMGVRREDDGSVASLSAMIDDINRIAAPFGGVAVEYGEPEFEPRADALRLAANGSRAMRVKTLLSLSPNP
jgi:hypothetical protein